MAEGVDLIVWPPPELLWYGIDDGKKNKHFKKLNFWIKKISLSIVKVSISLLSFFEIDNENKDDY